MDFQTAGLDGIIRYYTFLFNFSFSIAEMIAEIFRLFGETD